MNPEKAPVHVTAEDSQRRSTFWANLHKESPSSLPEDPIFSEWEQAVPRNNYGELSVTKAVPLFERGFKNALEDGSVRNFIAENVTPDFDGVYLVKTSVIENDADIEVRENHTTASLDRIQSDLHAALATVEAANMPQQYKAEYTRAIRDDKLQFIKAAREVGDVGFTINYKSAEQWAELVDVDKSEEAGQVVLKYEDEAREALRIAREKKDRERQDVSVKEALQFWNLSEEEKVKMGFDEIGENDLDIDGQKTGILFEIMLDRLGLTEKGWKVVVRETATAVTTAALSREIRIPGTRRLKGWDVRNIAVHEPFHAVRGENGRMQGLKILGEGVDDYLKTEEGAAAVTELVFGQKFGDDRQVKFAGRYLAVALALKAKMGDGQIQPQYSMQEIYSTLKEEGVTVQDAKDIVWRIFRGTSLKQKGLLVPVKDGDNTKIYPAAECFPKDTVYFEGQMEVFNWIKNNIPLAEGQRRQIIDESLDFSDRFLARVGRAREVFEDGESDSLPTRQERYSELVQKGRETLMELLSLLGRGKMRLDFLDEGSGWEDLLTSRDMINFADILRPKAV